MRKGKNGQADLDKGFKTGYFSFFNHQACVFYLCDMNYRAVQEKRKHLKYQGFLPWNKGRSIGQSKKTVQYSYPCPYVCGLQSGYLQPERSGLPAGGTFVPYKRFAAGKTLAQAESTPAEHVKFTVVSIKRIQVQSYISQQFQNFRI